MTRTPEGLPDDPNRPDSRRWPWQRAGWIGWLRPGDWIARVRSGSRATRGHRLLFLDDDPNRAELFLRDHPQAVWVTTVPNCLARLAEPWDEVHLDHDLGGMTFVDSSNTDCGMEVIRWLCKEPRAHLKSTLFFVHTHNATAGLLMVLLMRGAGFQAEFRPFGLDLEKLLAHNETGLGSGPNTGSRASRWIGRVGWLRPVKKVVAAGLDVLDWGSVRLRLARTRGKRSRPAGSGGGVRPTAAGPRAAGEAQREGPPGEVQASPAPSEPQRSLPG
jgi:hypothetical protein